MRWDTTASRASPPLESHGDALMHMLTGTRNERGASANHEPSTSRYRFIKSHAITGRATTKQNIKRMLRADRNDHLPACTTAL